MCVPLFRNAMQRHMHLGAAALVFGFAHSRILNLSSTSSHTATAPARLMHPHLHVDRHPFCREEILALKSCHAEHPVAKFWGVCNGAKLALDECFRAEKVVKRDLNRTKARAEKERLRKRLEENLRTGEASSGAKWSAN